MENNDYFEDIEDTDVEEIVGQEQDIYEHFRFVVDKGQALVRIDKYLVNCMAALRVTVFRKLPIRSYQGE
jgi:hypothetical protein